MKKLYAYQLPFYLTLYVILVITSCRRPKNETTDLTGNWTTAADFQGDPRSDAACFVIGDNAYVATGVSGSGWYNDMFVYNLTSNNWSASVPPLPGGARSGAVAFAVNGKGYIGTGYNNSSTLKDFWEYDPAGKTWVPKDDLPGNARVDAVAFTIGNRAYVFGGNDGKSYNDCWEFDPSAPAGQQWSPKATFPYKVSAAMAFVLNNKAYVVGGSNSGSGEMRTGMYMYDPATNQWIEKRRIYNYSDEGYDDKYTSIERQNAVAFVMGDYAYITTGENGGLVSNTWRYDPVSDTWLEKTGFEAKPREGAVAFTINNRAFVLTGRSGTLYMDNTFEFHPDAEKVEGD